MRISKRNPIFVLVSILTFAVGVLMTPRELPHDFTPENVLVVRQSPWKLLLTFENQDLQQLDQVHKEILDKTLESLTGKRYENVARGEFEPVLFQSMLNGKGEKRYLLVELATLWMIPGSSTLRIHVFDTAGYILNAQEFDTGNRTFVTSMRISRYRAIERQLLIVEGQYSLTDHTFTQFYTLTDDRIEKQEKGQLDHKASGETR